MSQPMFDVVVYGATSFVGQIVCRTLLREFGGPQHPGPRALRWAIAGRSQSKLDALVTSLGSSAAGLPTIVADAADDAALEKMCAQTRVVASTVGPYSLYGEPLVRACSKLGTDCCDLTGEAPWMKRMIKRYAADAERSGARIVHGCGFDSIPSDMGVWFLQRAARARLGAPCRDVKMRVQSLKGSVSGGTVASMLQLVREASRDAEVRRDLRDPYLLCPPDAPRVRQRITMAPSHDVDARGWLAPFIMAGVNVPVVLRSDALQRLALTSDAAPLRYDEAMRTGAGLLGWIKAAGWTVGLGALFSAVALSPLRWLLEKLVLPAPGQGPSERAQERGSFELRFWGRVAAGAQHDVRVRVVGQRDPGYGATARMLAEAAACLAVDIGKDALPGGFWTPSTAMGDALLQRLQAHAGVTFSEDTPVV